MVGFPVVPGGQEHAALWLVAMHIALVLQGESI